MFYNFLGKVPPELLPQYDDGVGTYKNKTAILTYEDHLKNSSQAIIYQDIEKSLQQVYADFI